MQQERQAGRPPAGLGAWLVGLAYGFLLRCPVCRKGSVFQRPWPWSYARNERCPCCWVRFTPDSGEVSGAMAITMVLTSILGVAGVIYLAFFTKVSGPEAVALLVGLPTLFALWFFRHAHGMWVVVLYLTDNLDEAHPLARPRR